MDLTGLSAQECEHLSDILWRAAVDIDAGILHLPPDATLVQLLRGLAMGADSAADVKYRSCN